MNSDPHDVCSISGIAPSDGRSSLIELTPYGQQRLADATRTFSEELEVRLGSTVPPQSLEQFAATLRQLHQGIQAQGERNQG